MLLQPWLTSRKMFKLTLIQFERNTQQQLPCEIFDLILRFSFIFVQFDIKLSSDTFTFLQNDTFLDSNDGQGLAVLKYDLEFNKIHNFTFKINKLNCNNFYDCAFGICVVSKINKYRNKGKSFGRCGRFFLSRAHTAGYNTVEFHKFLNLNTTNITQFTLQSKMYVQHTDSVLF